MVERIHWLGHDTFRIDGEKIIYTDPFKIKRKDRADLILISHEHYDHCSPDDLALIAHENTVIVATPDCRNKLTGDVHFMQPGDSLKVAGIAIQAVRAYNTNKKFHTRDRNWVGYIFTMNGKRFYFAGDTDHIPEMKELKDIDIAFLPVSGKFVMTAEEAAQAALDFKPGTAIPMHYGTVAGSEADARRFAALLEGKVNVAVLDLE